MTDKFKIGHYTDTENLTGCTVILCPQEVVASCYISGFSPGSRETALLDPHRKIESIQALLLTGGSAFGLNAAEGVVRYLEERQTGYFTNYGIVPLVPAAVIFDLNLGNSKVRPNAENAFQACLNASSDFSVEGCIGAGTGASVGKWAGLGSAMKSGTGISCIKYNDAWIRGISVVNAVGDVLDEKGHIIAGALNKSGRFLAENDPTKRWRTPGVGLNENTVLCVLLSNIRMTKLQMHVLARKSEAGLIRAIIPSCTNYDGDIIFAVSNKETELHPDIAYEMGVEAIRKSILSAVQKATGLGGLPSISDLLKL